MADEANNGGKVVITIDAETKQFTVKMTDVQNQLHQTSETGVEGFSKMLMGATGLNQALELGHKAVELVRESFEKMEHFEGIQNQQIALVSVGKAAGYTQDQIKSLLGLMQKASHETITTAEASEAALRLLSVHFKAENIPLIVEWAKKTELASGGQKKFAENIEAVAISLRNHNARPLGETLDKLTLLGDRQKDQITIIEALKVKNAALGDGFLIGAQKMKTSAKELEETTEGVWGRMGTAFHAMFTSDKIEKASANLGLIKVDLESIGKAADLAITQANLTGAQAEQFKAQFIQTEVARVEAMRLENHNTLVGAIHKENEELAEGLKTIKEINEQSVAHSDLEGERAEQLAVQNLERQRYQSGKIMASEYYSVLSAAVKKKYDDERRQIQGMTLTETEFKNKMVELEARRFEAMDRLRVTDRDAFEATELAKMQFLEQTDLHIENASQKHAQSEIAIAEREHQEKLQRLRLEGNDKTAFQAKALKEEERYQKELARIQVENGKLSAKNVKMGWHSAMAGMQAEWGSWGKVTQKVGTQTHSVLSKGFIDMAKAHKFSMDQMLSNFVAMIGETLIQKGTADLLMSIFPPNPAGMAVAGAEIALGSALVGATSGASSDVSGGGFAGGGAPGVDSGGSAAPSAASAQEINKKSASIIINGDFLNSRETANHLADVLRQNSDITDYTITAQGRSFA